MGKNPNTIVISLMWSLGLFPFVFKNGVKHNIVLLSVN